MLNLIRKFVDGDNEETQADEEPVQLEHLTNLRSDYYEIQNELTILDEATLETHIEAVKAGDCLLAHQRFSYGPQQINVQQKPFPNRSRTTTSFSVCIAGMTTGLYAPGVRRQGEKLTHLHGMFVWVVHSSPDLSSIHFFLSTIIIYERGTKDSSVHPDKCHRLSGGVNFRLVHFQNTDGRLVTIRPIDRSAEWPASVRAKIHQPIAPLHRLNPKTNEA